MPQTCTVPASEDNEMIRKHKAGDVRCKKENLSEIKTISDNGAQSTGVLPDKINLTPKNNTLVSTKDKRIHQREESEGEINQLKVKNS